MSAHSFNDLYKNLGYSFKNDQLLSLALSHRSYAKKNNERLEFFGDSLLGVIIAEEIYIRHPEWDEGIMSRVRSSLVNEAQLAATAIELGINNFVKLGAGESATPGEVKHSLLADALEAVIAAIYLDSSIEQCKQCVLNWLKKPLLNCDSKTSFKDSKSTLQEYLQKKSLPLPEYGVVDRIGPEHKQLFVVKCSTQYLSLSAIGKGNNKQQAEQDAASKILDQINNNL